MAEVSTNQITSQDASCQNTLGRITSSTVKHDPLCHQVTLMVPGNYNAAMCHVLVALVHITPMKENNISPLLVGGWLFEPTSPLILQQTYRNNFLRLLPYLLPKSTVGSSYSSAPTVTDNQDHSSGLAE